MKYKHLEHTLDEFAKAVISLYREKLKKDNRKASGNLINNISFSVKDEADSVCVYLSLEDYWEEVELGRRPTKNKGRGVVKQKIAEWVTKKGIQEKADANGKLPTTAQLTYLITRKIHEQGYTGGQKSDGDGYLASTLKELLPKYLPMMENAMREDARIEFIENFKKYLERGLEGI